MERNIEQYNKYSNKSDEAASAEIHISTRAVTLVLINITPRLPPRLIPSPYHRLGRSCMYSIYHHRAGTTNLFHMTGGRFHAFNP